MPLRSQWLARAALAATVLALGIGYGRAQSDDRFLFAPRPPAPIHQPAGYPPSAYLPPASSLPKITVTPLPGQGVGAPAQRYGTRMVCVRTCDGYFFPMGAGGSTDRAIAEFMCKASCPGAPVKLFTVRGPEIEDAVGPDRSLYRRLAGALSFRSEVSPACSCRRPSGAITAGPVFDDPTLRPGDVIVVGGRALVFRGGTRPYTERDFARLEQSSLPAEARQKLSALLYFRSSVPASRGRKPATAIASSQAPLGTKIGPRIVLPFPLELDPLPATASAFAPAD